MKKLFSGLFAFCVFSCVSPQNLPGQSISNTAQALPACDPELGEGCEEGCGTKPNINDILTTPPGLPMCGDPSVTITPLDGEGNPAGGPIPVSPTEIFDEILENLGIARDCSTDPSDLWGPPPVPGVIDHTDDSGVVNEGGERITIAFRITYTICGEEVSYIAIFSYDKVGEGPDSCAFELFLRGPMTENEDGEEEGELVLGLAINKEGCSLDEVPLTIADVHNTIDEVPPGTPVKPGVAQDGVGCLQCHGSTEAGNATDFFWRKPKIKQTDPGSPSL